MLAIEELPRKLFGCPDFVPFLPRIQVQKAITLDLPTRGLIRAVT
jgi:hypothetical protein